MLSVSQSLSVQTVPEGQDVQLHWASKVFIISFISGSRQSIYPLPSLPDTFPKWKSVANTQWSSLIDSSAHSVCVYMHCVHTVCVSVAFLL